jgi:hypothetical protein
MTMMKLLLAHWRLGQFHSLPSHPLLRLADLYATDTAIQGKSGEEWHDSK